MCIYVDRRGRSVHFVGMGKSQKARDRARERRSQARQLAAAVDCDWRTALKWLEHAPVLPAIDTSLERAAEDLGIDR